MKAFLKLSPQGAKSLVLSDFYIKIWLFCSNVWQNWRFYTEI